MSEFRINRLPGLNAANLSGINSAVRQDSNVAANLFAGGAADSVNLSPSAKLGTRDVTRDIVANVAGLSLDEALGQVDPRTAAGLRTLAALG